MTAGGSTREEIAGEEEYVGRSLGQTAHEPGEPEGAVGNQHIATVAITHEPQLF